MPRPSNIMLNFEGAFKIYYRFYGLYSYYLADYVASVLCDYIKT
jgi:hypothetical protein